jgi:hypothetical protein
MQLSQNGMKSLFWNIWTAVQKEYFVRARLLRVSHGMMVDRFKA